MIVLWSSLKNGKNIKNNPKGIIKNWVPPHAEIEKDVSMPAPKIFIKIIFLFLEFIPLKNK